MNRYVAVLTAFAVGACATPQTSPVTAVSAAAPQATWVPSDASPSDVYVMYNERLVQTRSELEPLAEKSEALDDAGNREEALRIWNEALESTDPETMTPFVSRAWMGQWAAMPVAERRMAFVQLLDPAFTPSRVEVRSESAVGDRATLDVRGYFDEVVVGEPGWRKGTVTLAREEGRWKVDAESWGAPGSGEADARRGRFEVTGEVEGIAESVSVSNSRWESYGAGWGFGLSDETIPYVVLFNNIPDRLQPGEYPLVEPPSIPADANPTLLDFPLSVMFAEKDDTSIVGETWDEEVTGTLTIEVVENGKMSGRFEFSAESFIGEAVNVRGSFLNVEVPQQ